MTDDDPERSASGAEPDEQLLSYVEEVARLFARHGLPLITGRIIGWLMVCDPPAQSAQQIGRAISASKASLSNNMRVLTQSGFVGTTTRPGDRVTYYRIDDDAWLRLTRRRLREFGDFRDLTARGLELLGTQSPRSARVRDAHALFDWLDRELTPLLSQWARHEEDHGAREDHADRGEGDPAGSALRQGYGAGDHPRPDGRVDPGGD